MVRVSGECMCAGPERGNEDTWSWEVAAQLQLWVADSDMTDIEQLWKLYVTL